MTRENILALLPPGRAISDCIGECAIETGREIGAQYVVTGEVTRFGGELRVTINLHETKEGNLLGQRRVGAGNVLDLEVPLEMETLALLGSLRSGRSASSLVGETSLGGGVKAWKPSGMDYTVVSFESEPPGATVEVDGVPLCETPCSQALPDGTVEVAFKLLRYMPTSSIVQIDDSMEPVFAGLTPNFGWLTITSEPSGLDVDLDGERAGKTPVRKQEIGHGMHEVWLRDPYRHDEGKRVMIERGVHETLHLQPVPINGGLRIAAVDWEGNALQGDVLVDGLVAGRAWKSLTVQAGPREVEFRSDLGTWRDSIIVTAEELLVVEAKVGGATCAGANSINLEMVEIPAGSFQMGSPADEKGRFVGETQHRVTLTEGFLLSATEVTQAQWEAVMGSNPSHFKGAERPVDQVSWLDCVRFCIRLSELEGLDTVYRLSGDHVTWYQSGRGYRLPTEAEWEYACRAGTITRYHSGNSTSDLHRVGWFDGDSNRGTLPVGEKSPNAWGLHDMHGNVFEWCWDRYGDYLGGSMTDPRGSKRGSSRVFRGGHWGSSGSQCRAAYRTPGRASSRGMNVGFRIALDI